ncbi:MAG: hypothetical protein KC586_28725 [Myxococcales bacterium]|nr:hypothetical protein [Myxococcales bacterium]
MRAATVAVAFSVGGHAVLAWTAPMRAPSGPTGSSAWDEGVELALVELPSAEPAEPEPDPRVFEPASVPRPATVATLVRRARPSLGAPIGGATEAAAGSVGSEAEPEASAAPSEPTAPIPSTSAPAPWNLVPSAVARGDVRGQVEGLPTEGDRTRALEAAIDGALRAAARPGHLSERPPPELHPTRDGGYTWRGTGFTARIEPDGSVSFEDLPPIRFDGPGGPEGSLGVGFRFDLTEGAERRHGNDPYYADRTWFLRETEEVRDRLARRHAEELDRRQLTRLRGRIEALVDDTSRPLDARHRAVFALWDDFEEDEVGRRARRTLVGFVRERWPRGSADAFTDAELTRLNAGRVSTEPFAPYAEGVDEDPVRK